MGNESYPEEIVPLDVDGPEVAKLRVGINQPMKDALEGWSQFDNVTVTETVRRMASLYSLARQTQMSGESKEFAIVDTKTGEVRVLPRFGWDENQE